MPGLNLRPGQVDMNTAKIFRVCHLKGHVKVPENIKVIAERLTMGESSQLAERLNAEEE